MAQDQHVHSFSTRSSESRGHRHNLYGTTGRPRPSAGGGHYHLIAGRVAIEGRYAHDFSGRTGPAVPQGKGTHVHAFRGQTNAIQGHRHIFTDRTGRGGLSDRSNATDRAVKAKAEPEKGFWNKLWDGVQEFFNPPEGSGPPAGPSGPTPP